MKDDDQNLAKEKPDDGARSRARFAEWGSLSALAVSFFALALSAYQAREMSAQTRLMQSQARAGVWPYLSIGYSLHDTGEKRGYAFEIDNDGVGPARIESVTMTLDGKPVGTWREIFHAFFGDVPVPATYSKIYGKVLPPNTNRETTIEALRLSDIEQARAFYAAQDRLGMTICYCSVYDDCWIARRSDPEVRRVDRCDASGVQFEEKM
ncbi:MAG TPA: hypothetical protein VHE32_02065 [Rhodanobacteraceae bacterium]|nr:hypothetical protein [Rhodanobacteraceae bacterium]